MPGKEMLRKAVEAADALAVALALAALGVAPDELTLRVTVVALPVARDDETLVSSTRRIRLLEFRVRSVAALNVLMNGTVVEVAGPAFITRSDETTIPGALTWPAPLLA
jgi:hypothetical protein